MSTEEQSIKPTLGEEITELYGRVAKLNDIAAALLNPNWGANVGIIPRGHPLYPDVLEPLPGSIVKAPALATSETPPACIHPDGYDGECPCPTSCSCCPVAAATQTPASTPDGPQEPRTGPGRQPDHPDTPQAATEQLRADANTWRLKAIRRALTASRLRGTIDACLDLVDEPVTDPTAWGDGYRAGIADLREVLREFGQLQPRASGQWLPAGTRDLSIPDQPQEQQ